MARSNKKLGDILIEWGAISADQLSQAEGVAKGSGKRLGDVIVEQGFAPEESVTKALAQQFGLRFLDLKEAGVAEKIDQSLIPEDLIRKHMILPLEKEGGRLKLIIHDPMDLELLDMLRFRLNVEIDPRLVAKSQIKAFIEGTLGAAPKQVGQDETLVTESIDRTIDRSVDRSVDRSIDVAAEDAPIVRLCNRILVEAEQMRASDIHIEPMAERVRLRYRIDGVCQERDNLPKRMQNALLSRVKLMSGMNIAERRIPQDGRIKMPMDERQIDFRVSACPAYHGESVVLRILRPESVKIGLENLGFEPDNLQIFNRIIRRPNGIFLVTGPTGSGKTTTLYSALDVLNRPDVKIITAEDPVEYNFAGINQCQVRERIGLTFAAILRSMLRQAPNIVLVGEIRDKEVADIAIQAALTGHLVFSTLHTNDAPSAITRLIDMGVKPFLVASSIQAIMAQRLIRVLCNECKAGGRRIPIRRPSQAHRTSAPGRSHRVSVVQSLSVALCAASTGYKGRKAIFEMMIMNAQVQRAGVQTGARIVEDQRLGGSGQRHAYRWLPTAKIKIMNGTTTPGEVDEARPASKVIFWTRSRPPDSGRTPAS